MHEATRDWVAIDADSQLVTLGMGSPSHPVQECSMTINRPPPRGSAWAHRRHLSMACIVLITLPTMRVATAADPGAQGVSAQLLSVLDIRRQDVSLIDQPIDPTFTSQSQSSLDVAFDLQGPAMVSAVLIGHAVILDAHDDHGHPLYPSPLDRHSAESPFRTLVARKTLDFFRRDADAFPQAVAVTLRLTAPDRTARSFSLHGTIQVVTGQVTDMTIPNVCAWGIPAADAAQLAQDAVAMTLHLNEGGQALIIDGSVGNLLECDLVDAKGGSLMLGQGSELDGQGTIVNYMFRSPSSPIPASACLALRFVKHRQVLTVPIDAERIPLP
jgi:hypothetical protein